MGKYVSVKRSVAEKAKRHALKKHTRMDVSDAQSVDIVASPAEVSNMEQHGQDLVVRFADGSTLTLAGYFDCSPGAQASLTIGDQADGQRMAVSYENGICGAGPATAQTLAYSLSPASDGTANAFLPAAAGIGLGPLLGLGAAMGGAAAAAGGGSGGDANTGDGGPGAGGGGVTPPADQTPPAAPAIAPTNGRTITGTAEAGATITLDLDGNGSTDATVSVGTDGTWTYTPNEPLPDRAVITGRATDAAGNVSQPATATVDAATPVPLIGTVLDDVGLVVGAVANGGTSDDQRPTISGSGAEAGATVAIFDGDTQIGSATADAAGTWSFTPSAPLADGLHTITAQATDALGNDSARSPAFTLTIAADDDGPGGPGDPTPPSAPVIALVLDDVGTISGPLLTGAATDDGQPTLSGTANAGALVTLFDGGTALGSATADATGAWSFTPSSPLADGNHVITAQATVGGLASPASTPFALVVDTLAPSAPVITPSNGTTLNGSAEPGANVLIDIDGNGSIDATVSASTAGVWRFTPATPLADGVTVTARASDAAGNVSGPSSTVVDAGVVTQPPAPPVIGSITDDFGVLTGAVAPGGLTDDRQPALGGTAAAGATVTIFDGGISIGSVVADTAGNWSFTPPAPLGDGQHGFTATATTAQGTSASSASYSLTIDATPPTAPTIGTVTDDFGVEVGVVASGGLTDDAQPAINGAGAEAGATVTVFDGGTTIGTATADGAGNWSLTPTTALGEGQHVFSAAVTDAAGNTGPASATYTVVVDTLAPTATIDITEIAEDTGVVGDFATEDATPVISGTLSAPLAAGERVEVRLDGAGAWATATANGTGWYYGPGTLAAGNHTFEARVIDLAGNIGSADAQAITITATPNRPPIALAANADLLGLAGAEALELVQIGGQSLTAFDPDGNIASVTVQYAPLVNLGDFTLTASAALAEELGLQFSVVNVPGALGVLTPSSTLTITAADGGPIDNQSINELLATVHFEQGGLLGGQLQAPVLGATSITVADAAGESASASTTSLVNLGLLDPPGPANVVEGGAADDTLVALGGSARLYGHAGSDTLTGGDGHDLLRGGTGADILIGGDGNDVLVWDAADITVDGGLGQDILLVEAGNALALNAETLVSGIERVHLGFADGSSSAVLTEEGILAASSNGQIVITGDAEDTVTLADADLTGQVLVDGNAYDVYALGNATALIQASVTVVG